MQPLKDRRPSKPEQRAVSSLILHQAVVLLLLTPGCAGQSLVVKPLQKIVAVLGDDISLPCHLEPAVDATRLTVEWRRSDLNPRFVFVWLDGVELASQKHPAYVGRTSVSADKLKQGDVSLNLHRVQLSDEGTYGCFLPTPRREALVELVVGRASSPVISFRRTDIECQSEGWYPEPEVSWLDGEDKHLSAVSTETVRGPDGLYTVSSRLTVEEKHSSSFTCRIQQKNINQTREAYVRITDDFFSAECSSTTPIILSLVVVLMGIIAVIFLVGLRRRKQKSYNLTLPETALNGNPDNLTLELLNSERGEPVQESSESSETKELDQKQTNQELLEEVKLNYETVIKAVSYLMELKKDINDKISDLEKGLKMHEKQEQPPPQQINKNLGKRKTRKNSKEKQNEMESSTMFDMRKQLEDKKRISESVLFLVKLATEKKEMLSKQKEELEAQVHNELTADHSSVDDLTMQMDRFTLTDE